MSAAGSSFVYTPVGIGWARMCVHACAGMCACVKKEPKKEEGITCLPTYVLCGSLRPRLHARTHALMQAFLGKV